MSKKHTQEQDAPILISLDKRHVELLSDLVIEVRRLGSGADTAAIERAMAGIVGQSEERRAALVGLLHRALGDPSYFVLWLEAVRKAVLALLPYEELSDEVVDQVVSRGAAELDLGKAAYLALSPDQLQVISDEILEEMPWFWVERVEEAMTLSAQETGEHRRTAEELLAEVQERLATRRPDREMSNSDEGKYVSLDALPSAEESPSSGPASEAIRARLAITTGTSYWEDLAGKVWELYGGLTRSGGGMIVCLPNTEIDLFSLEWRGLGKVAPRSHDELHFAEAIELPLHLTGERDDHRGRVVVELVVERKEGHE